MVLCQLAQGAGSFCPSYDEGRAGCWDETCAEIWVAVVHLIQGSRGAQ
jgi:hypothetical protein